MFRGEIIFSAFGDSASLSDPVGKLSTFRLHQCQRLIIEFPALRLTYPNIKKACALSQTLVRICTSAFPFDIARPDVPAYWLQTVRSCNKAKTHQNSRYHCLDSNVNRQCRRSRWVVLGVERGELMRGISSA